VNETESCYFLPWRRDQLFLAGLFFSFIPHHPLSLIALGNGAILTSNISFLITISHSSVL
jgi:hypothetical protein